MDDAALHRITDRLFQAFVDHDLDAVEAMLTPDAALSQNGHRASFAEVRPMIEGLTDVIGDHRYENDKANHDQPRDQRRRRRAQAEFIQETFEQKNHIGHDERLSANRFISIRELRWRYA